LPTASKDGSSSRSCRSAAKRAVPGLVWRCARKSSSCMADVWVFIRGRGRARSSIWRWRS